MTGKLKVCLLNQAVILLVCVCACVTGITFEDDTLMTLEQKEILDKFRTLVKDRLPHDYMKEDIYLVAWLRAKNYDIQKAETFLMQNLEWREKNRIDTIGKEDWSDLEKDYKYYLGIRDKTGRSVLYFDTNTIDVRAAVLRNGERFLRYCDKAIEESCLLVRDLGQKYGNITRGHLMFNLKGFNTYQHGCLQCIPYLVRIVLSYRDHYPGCVDKMIVFNAPGIIEPILRSIKMLLNRKQQDRLKIYGTNVQYWKAELAKDFDTDKLPKSAGGTAILDGEDEDL